MKRVLITGATGFIGRHCLPFLHERGFEVHATYKTAPLSGGLGSPRSQGPDTTTVWHNVDLFDWRKTADLVNQIKPTHLLHLGWYVRPGNFLQTSEENFNWLASSIALLKAFTLSGGKKVVMVGSCKEYDWRYGFCKEELTPLAPISAYGISKHTLQETLSRFAKENELSATWARIFFVFGPHDFADRPLPKAIISLLQGKPTVRPSDIPLKDYLYVADAADALVSVLDSNVSGAINIGSGQPTHVKDVFDLIGRQIGAEHLIETEATPKETTDAPLLVADVKRLFNEVGWRPRHTIEDAVEKTVSWWQKELAGKAEVAPR